MLPIRPRLDPSLHARVTHAEPMLFASNTPGDDRPRHVRAASALVPLGERWVIAQDDLAWLAVRTPGTGIDAVALPAGPDGRRRFEKKLGNKAQKPDLEAAVVLPGPPQRVLCFGSGSLPNRERIAIWLPDTPSPPVFRDATELYAIWRNEKRFSGSEMNIEGAAVSGDSLYVAQRSNGAPTESHAPIDAIGRIDLDAFVAWLEHRAAAPLLREIHTFCLQEDDERLGFTDLSGLSDGLLLFSAVAEDSPDAVEDGEVGSVRIGWFDVMTRQSAWTPLLGPDGEPFAHKVEGISRGARPGLFHCVVDADDTDSPALWCDVTIEGLPR